MIFVNFENLLNIGKLANLKNNAKPFQSKRLLASRLEASGFTKAEVNKINTEENQGNELKVQGIMGALGLYHKAIRKTTLAGPTYFAGMLKRFLNVI